MLPQFFVLLVIVFYGSGITVIGIDVPIINVTGYQLSQRNAIIQRSSTNDGTSMVDLNKPSMEVMVRPVVESGIPGKVEKRRNSEIAIEIQPFSNDNIDRGEPADEIMSNSFNEVSDANEYREYENHRSGGSKMVDDEDEDEIENNEKVVEDDKIHSNLKEKAGRYYRRGPRIWDQWGKWTSCSVSCGAGKLTRWRHCVAGGCSFGEKEAQLKTCTLSACS